MFLTFFTLMFGAAILLTVTTAHRAHVQRNGAVALLNVALTAMFAYALIGVWVVGT